MRKGWDGRGALQLFEAMRQHGLQANVITHTAVISACRKGIMPDRALQLFDEMQQQRFHPNELTYTAISACGKRGMAENLQFLQQSLKICPP